MDMNAEEIEALLEQVEANVVLPRAAVAQLAAAGFERDDAQQMVFAALGGSDLVEEGEDGRERYVPSGKLVREVKAAMSR
jgi:hypothetical protein